MPTYKIYWDNKEVDEIVAKSEDEALEQASDQLECKPATIAYDGKQIYTDTPDEEMMDISDYASEQLKAVEIKGANP